MFSSLYDHFAYHVWSQGGKLRGRYAYEFHNFLTQRERSQRKCYLNIYPVHTSVFRSLRHRNETDPPVRIC